MRLKEPLYGLRVARMTSLMHFGLCFNAIWTYIAFKGMQDSPYLFMSDDKMDPKYAC